ncbi:efflux transporter outer membrane subunit [Burkholderia perseverans]|uniref:efflux transporter outer membrane subunit n=1 Tax=Burkholderia perseverans TaxID=2615214 RepID=UPI001FEDC27F|nr:efflux transporter outer membrane subunit [Burkholderia perseverans]
MKHQAPRPPRAFRAPQVPTRARAFAWPAALAGCLALAACTVGPDFKPPRADAPAQWHDLQGASGAAAAGPASAAAPVAGASLTDAASAPDAGVHSKPVVDADPDPRWWQAFHDPLLDRLVARAAHDNLDLQTAVLRIAEAREQLHQAAAQGLPNVRATASYQREQLGVKGILEDEGVNDQINRLGAPGSALANAVPGGSTAIQQGASKALDAISSPTNLWQAGFDASWELDLFGRVRRSVEAAGAETGAAVAGRDDALLSLEAEVAQTYLQYRGAQALRALAVELTQSQGELADLTRDRAAHGLTSQLDVRSAEAQLATLRAQLPQYDQQIATLRNGLAYLVGGAPGALDAELDAPGALPALPPTVPVGLPSTLARRRPDVRRAELELHAATAQVGVAVAQFYPDVSLTGQIGLRSTHVRELAQWSHLFYSAGPAISLPIFSGGALVSNLRLSKVQQQEAALAYRGAVLVALRDVDNALAVYRTDQTRHAELDDAVRAERGALDLARDSYRKGIVPFLDVLDAERQWSQARQQAVQGELQTTTDLVALYKALGGGWDPDAAPAANRAADDGAPASRGADDAGRAVGGAEVANAR